MKIVLRLAALALAATSCHLALAQAVAAKPANATGQCKDGSYSTAASKSGACRGHNGVKDWYSAAAPTAATSSAPVASAAKPAPKAAPAPVAPAAQAPAPQPTSAPAPAVAAAKTAKGPKANLASTPAAAGGGPGTVWVNTASNVYHCYGTDFYGKTKAGAYMSESDAKTKGARPDHGKACSK